MTDSNRNLAARALLVLAELGAAMGPPIERIARPALGPALACLSDKKKQVRGRADDHLCNCVLDRTPTSCTIGMCLLEGTMLMPSGMRYDV